MRSTLTILGIVIGVAAVIAMLSIGKGAEASITGSIGDLGSNMLFVYPGGPSQDIRTFKPLTLSDVFALRDQSLAPSISDVAPAIQTQVNISYNGIKAAVMAEGVTNTYFSVRNYKLTEGSYITDEQNNSRAMVALIGPDTARKFFERTEGIVGETIRIEGQPYTIIGVLESKGSSSFGSMDNIVMIPLTTAQTRIDSWRGENVDVIYASARSADVVESAIDEITQILRVRHRTEIGKDDFMVMSQQGFIDTAKSITGVMTIFLGGIAGISLLVGGIGIMNIMLVTVVERTREIGLRKALGARKKDILVQFLTESSMLSLFGGFLGIVLGWLIAMLVGFIASQSSTPFKPVLSFDAILMATLFSTAIGLFFGIYPANRAASLEPVEALRHE